MGEIADMMLEGDLCEGCGVALSGQGYGIPRYCSSNCAKDRGFDGINPDGTGRFGKRLNTENNQPPQNVLSIKITYKGNKVMHVIEPASSFGVASDIAAYLAAFLKELEITPKFMHPKVGK